MLIIFPVDQTQQNVVGTLPLHLHKSNNIRQRSPVFLPQDFMVDIHGSMESFFKGLPEANIFLKKIC